MVDGVVTGLLQTLSCLRQTCRFVPREWHVNSSCVGEAHPVTFTSIDGHAVGFGAHLLSSPSVLKVADFLLYLCEESRISVSAVRAIVLLCRLFSSIRSLRFVTVFFYGVLYGPMRLRDL